MINSRSSGSQDMLNEIKTSEVDVGMKDLTAVK